MASPELQKRYAAEYGSMLRVITDRDVAKEAARVNLSAMMAGEARIVPAAGRVRSDDVHEAILRGGEDLAEIRRLLAPALDRTRPPRGRDYGPER